MFSLRRRSTGRASGGRVLVDCTTGHLSEGCHVYVCGAVAVRCSPRCPVTEPASEHGCSCPSDGRRHRGLVGHPFYLVTSGSDVGSVGTIGAGRSVRNRFSGRVWAGLRRYWPARRMKGGGQTGLPVDESVCLKLLQVPVDRCCGPDTGVLLDGTCCGCSVEDCEQNTSGRVRYHDLRVPRCVPGTRCHTARSRVRPCAR